MADGLCSHVVKRFNELTGLSYYRYRDVGHITWQWRRVAYCPECGVRVPPDEGKLSDA